jgi:Autographiviridae endonuclease VII
MADRREYIAQWQREHPRSRKNGELKRAFGITIEQYDEMFKAQKGLCKLCRKPEPGTRNGKRKMLAVDHDHVTGKVRGLLCSKCNTALGLFNESPELLEAAITYLKG